MNILIKLKQSQFSQRQKEVAGLPLEVVFLSISICQYSGTLELSIKSQDLCKTTDEIISSSGCAERDL